MQDRVHRGGHVYGANLVQRRHVRRRLRGPRELRRRRLLRRGQLHGYAAGLAGLPLIDGTLRLNGGAVIAVEALYDALPG